MEKIAPKDFPQSERFFIPKRPKSVTSGDVSEKVLLALKNNFLLDFNYSSKWEPEEVHRKICPYQIILDEGCLYLYGASISHKDNPRLFNLSKMHDVEVITTETFELPENFKFREDFEKGRFGAFQYDESYDFKIEFYGDARKVVREFLWADNQVKVESPEEDKTTLSFSSSQWIPIFRWMLSFGENAKSVEPEWFVDHWKNSVMKMYRKL